MLSQKTRYTIRALQHLADTWRQGPVRLDIIAEKQNIPRKFLTVILSEMVREGLVTQRRDVRRDQRVVFVRATAGGRRRWATIEAAPRQLLKEMFGSLSAGDRGHLARILQELMPAGAARCEVRAEEKRPHA